MRGKAPYIMLPYGQHIIFGGNVDFFVFFDYNDKKTREPY